MEPELGIDDDNSETVSERSRNRICCQVGNLSEDSKASTLKLELDNNNLETDSKHSRYKEHCPVE